MKKLLLLLIIPFLSFGQQYGCMDETACNYNSEATVDNGSCAYPNYSCGAIPCNTILAPSLIDLGLFNDDCECVIVVGCTDPAACNYISTATIEISDENGCSSPSCYYPGEAFMGSISFVDTNDDNIADTFIPNGDDCSEISQECECCYDDVTWEYICGCMDINACNYDPDALLSNNSCLYDDGCVNIFEILQSKTLVTTINTLGKLNSNHNRFQLHIYDDGSVEKKYILK